MNRFSKKHVFFASASTIVEWYDFMLFAYLTPVIASVFFPDFSKYTAILMTFGVFAAGFFMGPIGSVVMGSFGDRFGRKKALIISVVMMILPMFVIAILPTYQTIGMLAPAILVLMRLLQGFSIGGSYGGVMVFMIESTKPDRRGFIASFATMSSGTGVFLASLVAMILFGIFSQEVLDLWGWRIGYIIGLMLALLALVMRMLIPESYSFEQLEAQGDVSVKPVREMFSIQKKPLFFAIALSAYANIMYYLVLSYLSSYFVELNYSEFFSLAIVTIFSLIFSFSAPLWGYLSDCLGRKPLIKFSIIIYLIFSYPSFMIMGMGIASLILAMVVLCVPLMAIWGAYGAAAPELFNTRYRYSGNGLSYNIGNSFFGGTIPFVATSLVVSTGSLLAPAWLLVVASIIMIPIVYFMPETRYVDV
ncbi:sugar (and other) transporter family protein [Francisella philomiragia subsp. philomiragia ATCC 25015]|uniref:MFS transporter n=1 Tax=Francisella philomiragia TaxID=28110 RepID=UPI0001AF79C7|nr:MFS transporter [Francisella philomiragia]AJI75270.1 sugar (and other) transporter family protein [Francisella philomiragia subsp. philomiragia ATCC 25015]EET21251.1 metabolite:H+ symporter [Francisella philomiragia subsp. philomiragia ATCC 25015]MBK2238903.1 MFS transporter [Francisella philomiragia]